MMVVDGLCSCRSGCAGTSSLTFSNHMYIRSPCWVFHTQAVLAQPFWKRRWTIVTLCFVAFMLCNMVCDLHIRDGCDHSSVARPMWH